MKRYVQHCRSVGLRKTPKYGARRSIPKIVIERHPLDNFLVPLLSALLGGIFVLAGTLFSHYLQSEKEKQLMHDKIYFDLFSIYNEVIYNSEICRLSKNIISDNQKIYDQLGAALTDSQMFTIKPQVHSCIEAKRIEYFSSPSEYDTLLLSICTSIQNYYGEVYAYNWNYDLYLAEFQRIEDIKADILRGGISTKERASLLTKSLYGDISRRERLLGRCAGLVGQLGDKCKSLISRYFSENNKAHLLAYSIK